MDHMTDMNHYDRINIGRRLLRLEAACHHSFASLSQSQSQSLSQSQSQSHDLLTVDLDHLATTLNRLLNSTSTDPLLLSYADRLKSLQSLVAHAQQGQLDTRPRPLYNLKAARLSGSSQASNLFDQLANEIRVQRQAQEGKRRELLNLTLSSSSSTSGSLPPPPVARSTVSGGIRQRGGGGGGGGGGSGGQSSSHSSASQSQLHSEQDQDQQSLDDHARLQDTLTANLASMAGILKANSLAFADGLKSDAAVLDQSEQLLSANTSRMASENTRLKKHRAAARWTTWTLVLVLIVVAAVSVGMFVVIKLFRK